MSTESNVVVMENGETLNFGKQGKCFSSFDLDTLTVTWKLVTGQVKTLSVTDLDEKVQKMAMLSGILKKVTALVPAVEDVTELDAKIQKELYKLLTGTFTVRGSGQGAAELDEFLTAFAIINAKGEIATETGVFAVPQAFIAVDDLRPEWVNVQDPKVIDEVLDFWGSLSAKDKTHQKRNNPYITILKNMLEEGSYAI